MKKNPVAIEWPTKKDLDDALRGLKKVIDYGKRLEKKGQLVDASNYGYPVREILDQVRNLKSRTNRHDD